MSDLNRLILKAVPAPMSIEIDTEASAVYVRFTTAKVKRTVADNRPGSITTVDFDDKNGIVGVEIVGLSGFSLKGIRHALPQRMRGVDLEQANLELAKSA
jgi:uncharacterized protein YuzE